MLVINSSPLFIFLYVYVYLVIYKCIHTCTSCVYMYLCIFYSSNKNWNSLNSAEVYKLYNFYIHVRSNG